MFQFTYSSTGYLYTEPNSSQAKKYPLLVDATNKLYLSQINPVPLVNFKPADGWPQSNEPEEHLDDIKTLISTQINPSSILAFSYKDISLAKRISPEIPDILFDSSHGLIPYPVEDSLDLLSTLTTSLDKTTSRYDLIICRHFIEHANNPLDILLLLKQFSHKDTLVYLEVPDCGKFIQCGNPLFLWEHHRSYFTYDSFLTFLQSAGCLPSWYKSFGTSIEPSLCTLFSFSDLTTLCHQHVQHNSHAIDESDFTYFINAWQSWFESHCYSTVIGYGVGHNFDRFLQFTSSYDYFHFMIDASESKSGLYLANSSLPIQSHFESSNPDSVVFVLGVHDRHSLSASQYLMTKYPSAKCFSIFGLPC